MTAPGPHSCWQRYALALVAATGLTLAATAAAAAEGSKPTAGPLWEAYPLDNGSTAATQPATSREPGAAPRPELHAESGNASAELQIAFLGCLAVALLAIARTAVVRRRRRPEGPTCEIWWFAAKEGGAFCATALERGGAARLIAASPRFERRQPGPPDQDRASRQAYTQLVRELMSNGWEPYERGNAWWETRLRRHDGGSVERDTVHG
jgi:hypothetical protein